MLGLSPNSIEAHEYDNIAQMLDEQSEQSPGSIIEVKDASADINIFFHSGVTKKQAFYKRLDTSTNSINDYILKSAPYSGNNNGGGGDLSNLNTDDSLYFDANSGFLRVNQTIAKEHFTLVGTNLLTLANIPTDIIYITINGVVIDSDQQYILVDKEITIVDPTLPEFSATVCYMHTITASPTTPFQTKAEAISREQQLLNSLVYGKSVYGIEYNVTHAAPEVTRIGYMPLHASLPVHSKMRRCLLDDDGNVNYYLHPNDSTKKDDGTPALLDGTDGQVMVEMPEYYVSYITEGDINRVLISLHPFENSQRIDKHYISAYKATLHNPTNKLSSVVNTTADYRGGNNNANNDGNAATLLGKPRTATSRINFDLYANNRGSRWKQINYQARKNLYWLITIEFATRHHQSAFSLALTPEGYKTGGLGIGPTDIVSAEWSAFNGYYPLFNCGFSNLLGNRTIELKLILEDFPQVGQTRATQVNSYRGIENFFGDVWEWTNGANIDIQSGIASAYVATGKKTSNTNFLGYKFSGVLAGTSGYIKEITFGKDGDILPKSSVGGSSTTFFCDYFYLGADGLRGLIFGGSANHGANAGSACANSNIAPTASNTTFGSRLCFF